MKVIPEESATTSCCQVHDDEVAAATNTRRGTRQFADCRERGIKQGSDKRRRTTEDLETILHPMNSPGKASGYEESGEIVIRVVEAGTMWNADSVKRINTKKHAFVTGKSEREMKNGYASGSCTNAAPIKIREQNTCSGCCHWFRRVATTIAAASVCAAVVMFAMQRKESVQGRRLSTKHKTPLPSTSPTLATSATDTTPSTSAPTSTSDLMIIMETEDDTVTSALHETRIRNLVRRVSYVRGALNDPDTAESAAVRYLSGSIKQNNTQFNFTRLMSEPARIVQRYALLALDFALQGVGATTPGPTMAGRPKNAKLNECSWNGVRCNVNGWVTEITWAKLGLSGRISSEVGLLKRVRYLDLGENRLRGRIPDSLYDMLELQHLYLHNNRLTGRISEKISQLFKLVHLYLGDNRLTGRFPKGLGSPKMGARNVRPLRASIFCNSDAILSEQSYPGEFLSNTCIFGAILVTQDISCCTTTG